MSPDALIERDHEIALVRDRLGRALGGSGGVIVIEGPPGIGISALVESALEIASVRGALTALVRVGADDGDVSLLRRWLAELGAEPSRGAPTQALLRIAEESPLVLAVDDAHRVDAASLTLAARLAGRLRGHRALLVAGLRSPGSGIPKAAAALLYGDATVIRPGPLTPDGTRVLLEHEVGEPVRPELAAAVGLITSGAPAVVIEVAAELNRARVPPSEISDEVARDIAVGVVARLVRSRVGDPSAISVAEVVAVLDGCATPARVARLLGRPAPAVHPVLDRLVDCGLLARADEPTYARAPERAAVLRTTELVRVQRLRSEASTLIAASGDALAAGRLLLDVDPRGDASLCETLWQASARAREQDRPGLAMNLLARMLAEPVAPTRRIRTLVALGTLQVTTGLAVGIDTLRHALNEARDPRDIADAGAALGWALAGGALGDDAARALLEARARVQVAGDGLDIALDAQIADMSTWDAELKPARRAARARLATAPDSALASAALLAAEAFDALAVARPAGEVADLSRQALANGALAESPRGVPTALSAALVLGYAGLPQIGIDHVDHVIARLRANDLPALVRPATAFRGALKLMLGRLAEAEEDLRAIIAVPWLVRSTPLSVGFLVLCMLERADDEGAAKLLAELDLEGGDLQELIPHAPFLYARGELRARRGDPHAALDDLRSCGRRLLAGGWTCPAVAGWRGSMARVLMGRGEPGEARALACEEVRLAELFADPSVLSRSLRAQAATVAPPEGRALLERAAMLTDAGHATVEHIAALVDLAASEIATGAAARARPRLHRALALARGIGAEAHARRAADLLRAAGGRARRADPGDLGVLTKAERRVAQLAAEGRTNGEISTQLVVSGKTVETHLGSVYRKLGIGSRAQLPQALGDHASGRPGPDGV